MITWIVERYGQSSLVHLLRYHTWEWACGVLERAECVSLAEDAKRDHGTFASALAPSCLPMVALFVSAPVTSLRLFVDAVESLCLGVTAMIQLCLFLTVSILGV